MRKELKYILKWLFGTLMILQIGLGIGWMLPNLFCEPMFQETGLLKQVADSLMPDEYMGILYPLLIRAAKALEGVTGIIYCFFLYVLQLGLALYSLLYMIKSCGWINRKCWKYQAKCRFTALYMLTFPLILQMHLAVLPFSLVASLSLILVCDGLHVLKKDESIQTGRCVKFCGLWVLTALLIPDYGWLAGIFVVLVFVGRLVKSPVQRGRILACMLAAILCIWGVGEITQTPGSVGRIQKSVNAGLLSRFVWPNFMEYSFFWPEEIGDTFTEEELIEIARYTEGATWTFGPRLEAKYGPEKANELYGQMARIGLGLNTKQILTDTGRDFFSYFCPQAAFQMQKVDNKSSLLAWNYGQLQEESPLLTKYYVNTSFAGWNILCLLGVFLILLKKGWKINGSASLVAACGILMAFWYTMQGAGMQDYKNVMLISIFWMIPIVKGWNLCD